MKISRLKKVQKNLGFYVNNFKFRKPYQILIDGTFSFSALENKFNIKEQLPKYFQTEVKLLTTQCIILELEKLGSKVFGAMLIVKQFAVHKCNHDKKAVSGSKCLLSMIGKNNESRYIIATQDRELQDCVRNIPGVPLLYLHGKAPNLESPSEICKQHAEKLRRRAMMTALQEKTLTSLKKQSGLIEEEKDNKPKKKRKKGGPNPLSCKKKKSKHVPEFSNKSGKVRKRKRVKVAAHIKEVLQEVKKAKSIN